MDYQKSAIAIYAALAVVALAIPNVMFNGSPTVTNPQAYALNYYLPLLFTGLFGILLSEELENRIHIQHKQIISTLIGAFVAFFAFSNAIIFTPNGDLTLPITAGLVGGGLSAFIKFLITRA